MTKLSDLTGSVPKKLSDIQQNAAKSQGYDSGAPQFSDVADGMNQSYWQAIKSGDTEQAKHILEQAKANGIRIGQTPQGFNGVRDQNLSAAKNFEIGYGHAAASAGQSVEQLGRHIGQHIGLSSPASVQAHDNAIQTQQDTYQHGAGSTISGSAGNIVGGVLNTLPAADLAVPAKGAGLIASATRGAATAGGLSLATQPVTNGGSSYWKDKLTNAAESAAIGGGIPALGRGIIRAGEEAFPGNAVGRLANISLKKANKTPFASESEALAKRTGIDMTPGMVSGSKLQTGLENLSRQHLLSSDIASQADTKMANQAIKYINKTMDNISPGTVSSEGVGDKIQSTVRNVVKNIADRRASVAAKQYGAIDKALGSRPVVRYDKTKQAISDLLNEYTDVPGEAASSIRKKLEGMLQDVEKNPAYSLQSAQKFRTVLGRAARGSTDIFKDVKTSDQARIAKKLFGSVSDDMETSAHALDAGPHLRGTQMMARNPGDPMAAQHGGDLMTRNPNDLMVPSNLGRAWKEANANYRRFSKLIDAVQASPLKRLVGDQVNVDDFMTVNKLAPEKVIKTLNGMSPSELKMVRNTMEKSAPDAWSEYKRLLVQDALDTAQTASSSEGANALPMNANKFVRALGGDNPQKIAKLRAIFNADEMGQINDAFMALRRLGDKFGTNHSNTALANEHLSFLKGGLRGAKETAKAAIGMRKIAKIMLNSDGRRALIKLSQLPPGSRQVPSLVGYLSSLVASPGSGDVGSKDQIGNSPNTNYQASQ